MTKDQRVGRALSPEAASAVKLSREKETRPTARQRLTEQGASGTMRLANSKRTGEEVRRDGLSTGPNPYPSREEFWNRWRRLAGPSLFFLAVIYYEELFLKLYCFHGVSLPGLLFTLLFSAPPALVLGALCGGAGRRWGPGLLVGLTALISLWMGSQTVYYHLFKTFLTLFSLTKMAMVAGAFGDMAVGRSCSTGSPF